MSPEVAVAAKWRDMFTDPYVKQHLVLVAVDEAHCIHEWLVSMVTGNNCVISARTYRGADFRKAFKCIGELRALVDIPFMALTASAPPLIESDIVKTLHLTSHVTVSCSLDRPNIYLSASPVCTLSVSMLHVILMCVFLRRMFTCSGTYMAYLIC